jgi:DNA polymerase II large subunit
VRGGACLVIAEGLCLKAPKVQKHVKRLGIDGWEFIDQFLNLKKKGIEETGSQISPSAKFLKDMLAGRPVLSYPSRVGGLRLRYGRTRATGLAALAMNPTTMMLLDEFVAIGTQVKIERPGKAGAITTCDTIEGPIVTLDNGDLVQVNEPSEAQAVRGRVKEIVDVGEILIPYGEFAENNHLLMPGGYCIEWHREEMLDKCGRLPNDWERPSFERALQMCDEFKIPLHPSFNLFWSDAKIDDILLLRQAVLASGSFVNETLTVANDKATKDMLEQLGALHKVSEKGLTLDAYARPLLLGLGLAESGTTIVARSESIPKSQNPLELRGL